MSDAPVPQPPKKPLTVKRPKPKRRTVTTRVADRVDPDVSARLRKLSGGDR